MSRGPGTLQKKLLLLLLGGLALGLSRSPIKYFRILRIVEKEWREINRAALWRAIRDSYKSKLVTARENSDGSTTLALSDKGRKIALTYKLDEIRIQKAKVWDKKWRLVMFDIPEPLKKTRQAMCFRLKQIGLAEFQKSVFVCPYPCDDEVDFLIEFYQVRPYVRKILAKTIDNELHLQQKFGLKKK